VKDIFCVWKNVRFSDDRKLILADAYLFGPYGKLMYDALQAGGEAGLSSVGFGDFLKDGTTIDPDSYMLDRPSDWVMNPSYQVFGRIEDKKEESVEKTEPLKEEVKPDLKETRMSTNIEKSYEKTLSLSVNALLKDADKKESIFEKAEIYESALSCLEEGVLPELRKTIEDKIVEINASIKELAKKQESLPNEKTKKLEARMHITCSMMIQQQFLVGSQQVAGFLIQISAKEKELEFLKQELQWLHQNLALENRFLQ
jgi:hypothetical protein